MSHWSTSTNISSGFSYLLHILNSYYNASWSRQMNRQYIQFFVLLYWNERGRALIDSWTRERERGGGIYEQCFVICAGAVLHVFAYWSDVSARTKQRCDSLILDHSAPRCYFTITCTLSQCKHINILKEQFTRVRKPSTHVTWFWIWRTFFLQCNIKAAECPSCSFPYNETCQRSVKKHMKRLEQNIHIYIYIYIYMYMCIYTYIYTHSLPTLLGTLVQLLGNTNN